MDELGREFAEDVGEAMPETGVASATAELRKRRSTRIVQAVPLTVAGVDALGRTFNERTSTLIINCHGCRYQSKHYVLKNMWVTLEVPHPEPGKPPRTVRGRVAWIQRPRTVRQLFQVALELELPGNAWGIAFPPDDWFAFPDAAHPAVDALGVAHLTEHSQPSTEAVEQTESTSPAAEADFDLPLPDTHAASVHHSERLRAFPAPASTTDASMQLARQVTRLLADARQQIYAAAREAAAQAVSAKHRISAAHWDHKMAADCEMLSREVAAALEKIRVESASLYHVAQNTAAEALQRDLPPKLAPQLEELTRDLTAQLSQEALAQRNAFAEQTGNALQTLGSACAQVEQLLERLREHAGAAEARIGGFAAAALREAEETARQHESSASALAESLRAQTNQIQEQASALLSTAQQTWQNYLAGEMEAAQGRVQIAVDNAIA